VGPQVDLLLSLMGIICVAIGGPHFALADGNMPAMGFTPDRFMPKKVAMPPQVSLLINHMVGIYGAAALGYGALCLLAAHARVFINSKPLKQAVCLGFLVWMLLGLAAQFTKPAGTGEDGSPATGPLPVLLAFIAMPTVGYFIA